jgi:hypothetical protein
LSNHWSQFVSADNPRGYNEKQKQRIADADTLVRKRAVEMKVMRDRWYRETRLMEPVVDEYGMECIKTMIAEVKAEYATKLADAGTDDVDEDGDISEGF